MVMNEIYCFKLVNGDEIIAKLSLDNDFTYDVTNPLAIVPSNTSMFMMRALYTAPPTATVSIKKDKVMVDPIIVRQDIRDKYIETTTGITPVSSNILME